MGRKTKFNSITSSELLAQVNPDNIELLDGFVDYLRSTQASSGTINGYINDIRIAFVWCLQHNRNKFFVDWTKRDIVKYQNWLIDNNENSPARIRRLKASLSSMSNYIENIIDDEFPNFRNIINKIKSPANQPVREKTVLTEEQIDELLAKLVENKRYDRACAFSLAINSGRRKAELLRFKVSDFNDDHLVCGGSLYQSDPIKTKGRGINGKVMKTYCLAKPFKPYFDMWMKYREENGIESEWLFPDATDSSKPASITLLNSWANVFSDMMGIEFYWHSCRHALTTRFKRAGIPDTVIQQYVGWADTSMVAVYSDIETDEQLSMYFTSEGIVIPKEASFSDL